MDSEVFLIVLLCVVVRVVSATCPAECNCEPFSKRVICQSRHGQNLKRVPTGIPRDTKYLELSFNSIATISDNDFRPLYGLRTLKLDNNALTSIAHQTFWFNYNQLREVNLDNNMLSAINDTQMWGLYNYVNKLTIRNNPIKYVNWESLSRLRFINHFDMMQHTGVVHLNCSCDFFKTMENLKRKATVYANCADGSPRNGKNWNDKRTREKYCGKPPESGTSTGGIIGGVVGAFIFISCCCRGGAQRGGGQAAPAAAAPPRPAPEPHQEPPARAGTPPPAPVAVPPEGSALRRSSLPGDVRFCLPEDTGLTELSAGPPSYQSIVPYEGGMGNPVFVGDLPPPPAYEEVAGKKYLENIGYVVLTQRYIIPLLQAMIKI